MYTPLKFAKEKQTVLELCNALDSRLAQLMVDLERSVAWSWTSEGGFNQGYLSPAIATALVNFDYAESEKEPPLQAVVCCGELAALQVRQVNAAKEALKECFVSFDSVRVEVDGERRPLALAILRDLGRSDMNRLLAYRHIYSYSQLPEIIGFSRSNVRTVARKTTLQVLAWLSKMSQENSESYRNTVMALPEDEPLALVKGRYSSQRANVKLNGERKMIPAHLPLLLTTASTGMPTIKAARVKPQGKAVSPRGDKRLCDTALFEVGAITVYRYREEYLEELASKELGSESKGG